MNQASTRFGKIAQNYANSEVHAASPSIKRLHEIVTFGADGEASVCDVACGAGHTGLSFATRAKRLVSVDPAAEMLEIVGGLAEKKDVTVERVRAFAEDVPLPTGSFDLVVSRLAPHHFVDIQKAVREMTRLAKPGGRVAVIDLEGNPDPELDALNHQLEMLHDPTHIRSYTTSRWRELFTNAGLAIEIVESGLSERPDGVPLTRWCQIADSGELAERQLRAVLEGATTQQLAAIGIRRDDAGEFRVPVRTTLIVGKKPV